MEDLSYYCHDGQIWNGYERSEASRRLSLEAPLISDNEDEFINFPSYGNDQRRFEKHDLGPEMKSLIENTIVVMDDMELQKRPTQQVDYLSHDWREEDLWASWRYIVSTRYTHCNSARLENASWRAWARMKTNLQVISRESIEWNDDGDVTWLYGPFQVRKNVTFDAGSSSHEQLFPRFRNLQDTQAKYRETTDHLITCDSEVTSKDSIAEEPPRSFGFPKSERRQTIRKSHIFPFLSMLHREFSVPKKNVRFHQTVDQCIVVDMFCEDEEMDEDSIYSQSTLSEWDSELECIVFKPIHNLRRKQSIRGLPPTVLNDGRATNPVVTGHVGSWELESFSSCPSNLIWLDASTPNSAHKTVLTTPILLSASTPSYQVIEAHIDNPYAMSDEECFEMEMFGGDTRKVQSCLPALDEIEEMCSLSPSISEGMSSESDEADDYDHPQPQHLALKHVADFQLSWQGYDDNGDEASWWESI